MSPAADRGFHVKLSVSMPRSRRPRSIPAGRPMDRESSLADLIEGEGIGHVMALEPQR